MYFNACNGEYSKFREVTVMRKPISTNKLQESIHGSRKQIGKTTLDKNEMASANSYRDKKPDASSINSCDVRAAAAMCQYAYYALNLNAKKKAKVNLIDGWEPMEKKDVDEEIGIGIFDRFTRTASGFNSMLFKKKKDGVKYYAYCTEGTEMSSPKDWFSNISQFLFGLSPQYTFSVQNAKILDKAIGNQSVLWFIGHSLGGGLASNNSLVTQRHAITFNAAGLNMMRVKATLLLNNRADLFNYEVRSSRIHAFVLRGEILNSFLEKFRQPAYGERTLVPYDGEEKAGKRHALTTVLDVMGIEHG